MINMYYLIINVCTFFIYGIDKKRAKTGAWRISEKTLILLAVFGGGLGALLGILAFHHKTRHVKFKILVPLFLFIHVFVFGIMQCSI